MDLQTYPIRFEAMLKSPALPTFAPIDKAKTGVAIAWFCIF
jgi:hypothetical protein